MQKQVQTTAESFEHVLTAEQLHTTCEMPKAEQPLRELRRNINSLHSGPNAQSDCATRESQSCSRPKGFNPEGLRETRLTHGMNPRGLRRVTFGQ
jgi:hypothetical protein